MAGLSLLLLGSGMACSRSSETAGEQLTQAAPAPTLSRSEFDKMPDGTAVQLYTLTNSRGTEVKITNYGATITSLKVADREGKLEDVVLGFDSLEGYLQPGVPYFGSIVGRYGNRIANARFSLDGQEYQLAANDGPNHLHGGNKGYDKVLWQAEEVQSNEGPALKLQYRSPDGEEGYPGNLDIAVTYTLTEADELKIDYQATTDKATVVNLTNHAYFNLSGELETPVLDHRVMINADRFIPVDETLIPTGALQPVQGTPFDFTQPTPIGERINAVDEQLKRGRGYDHCWVLKGQPGTMNLAASVYEPGSGRYLEVYTTEPGIQFYTGNFLDGSLNGKGVNYQHRTGFCLETEHFPDSPNQSSFPSVVLEPGETYHTQTTYKFSVKEQAQDRS